MKYACDTNFIVRYLIGDNEKMSIEAKKIFDQAQTGNISIILEQSVFCEVIFVLFSCYRVKRDDIYSKLSIFIMFKGIITDKELLTKALEIYRSSNLHILDCILYARTRTEAVSVLSFDKELLKVTNAAVL